MEQSHGSREGNRKFRGARKAAVVALGMLLFAAGAARAQFFTEITDSLNPIVAEPASNSFSGAAWVDMDGDGLLDLAVAGRRGAFRNLGGWQYEKISGVFKQVGGSIAGTWSDYDNDGDLDCFLTGGEAPILGKGSAIYRNDGAFDFVRIDSSAAGLATDLGGWGCAFADFDNDGYTDVVVAAANGFGSVTHENRLLRNRGDGEFDRIDSTVITQELDAHTIPTWSDYDMDGDLDLFIGSGEISRLDPDNHFRNNLAENGYWSFERIVTAPIATDSLDGQVWNWIDYDNDGDLDAFQTNYNGMLPNNLYRNDGGVYAKMTEADVGTIVSTGGAALANHWGDFDNDGDLDCVVTNGGGRSDYFRNEGDGSFTRDTTLAFSTTGSGQWGVTAGDPDEDGDLDLYFSGNINAKGLFRNDTANGNHWLEMDLAGAGPPAGSNLSAIGARVHVYAVIGGSPVAQIREVSAQNSFNSMAMLRLHFGLGDGTSVDSVVIHWPAGGTKKITNVAADQILSVTEETAATDVGAGGDGTPAPFRLLGNRPNPFNPTTRIDYRLDAPAHVTLRILDPAGRVVRTLADADVGAGRHEAVWDGRSGDGREAASGVYFYRLDAKGESAAKRSATRKMILIR